MEMEDTAAKVDRARHGDMEAFMSLFEEVRPLVFSVACRMVGPNDAEDVVMDACLKAWKAIPAFSGASTLKTWICRIAHNCAADCLRRRKPWDTAAPNAVDPVDPGALPDTAQRSPADAMADAETQARIDAALRQLPEEHRVTLTLRFADGLSYAEIAAATGVSLGTVMSRLFNGRRKLMKLLKDIREERA